MSAFGAKLSHWAGDGQEGYHFWCPGCDEAHMIKTSPSGWGFNDSGDAPTFTPSVLVSGVAHLTNAQEEAYRRGEPLPPAVPFVCHSFVTDGRIQFLSDCTHALAGQTVPLPDYPAGDEP
jgi:hypothetical protein